MCGLNYGCFYNLASCSTVLYAVIVCCVVRVTQQVLIFNLGLSSNTQFYLFLPDFIWSITANERKPNHKKTNDFRFLYSKHFRYLYKYELFKCDNELGKLRVWMTIPVSNLKREIVEL